ncbi:MAG TPA: DNA repair protein RadA [Prolixibacteraceae bacterium]|nr:DNA repair protein RadA [Prolixibacteraceae bacterium]
MTRLKSIFICQQCGAESPKWIGKCPSCGQWNTYVEEVVSTEKKQVSALLKTGDSRPVPLEEIASLHLDRINAGMAEFNRVLGGGLVPGSMVLIGGEPGIGKSTLVLQLALTLKGKKILYASGEESLQQIKLRAMRLQLTSKDCLFLCETSLESLLGVLEQEKPDIFIMDSIQTISAEVIESSPGSVTQVRECTSAILKYAKKNNVAVILIGHINKEGNLAGPKVLEHIVDTVIQFEGDAHHQFRILRSTKNRFGSTSELGIFEMRQNGLVEIANPSEHLISKSDFPVSGTAVAAAIEGIRPFMIEIQALVSSAAYGIPQRSATGFDLRRLNMLLAVLEKRAGFKLTAKDVFLNVAGGMKISDPASDLAILGCILSSNLDLAIDHHTAFAGEIGLTGEIRAVSRIEQRIGEADRLGFSRIFVPSFNKGIENQSWSIEIMKVARVEELLKKLFR